MRTALLILAALAGPTLWAGEYAVLSTGFRIRAERHSTDGARTTLYDRDGGYSVVPTSLITGFEPEDFVPPPAAAAQPPPPTPGVDSLVAKAARQHGVHPALIASVIAAESSFDPSAVSPKGAQGLMQLMPATAAELGVAHPFDAGENIQGGASYLKQLLDRYAGFDNQLERALAAYNAGPGTVERYGGLPPYRETVDFVSRVSSRLASHSASTAASSTGPTGFDRKSSIPAARH